MQQTDFDTPLLTIPLSSGSTSSRFVRLTCSGILIISCTIFGFTQCYAQDVAEAARQEKARKENQQKKPKHIYTDEDLKRAQILTPEDRAEVDARKQQQPLPGAKESQDSLDAQTLPADLPLGDVARRYRRLREMLRLEQSAVFHLPFVDEPVLATPKPLEIGVAPATVTRKRPVVPAPAIVIPAEPRIEPFQPPVKRSPFERPRNYLSPPPRSSVNRVTAPKAPAIGETPSQRSNPLAARRKPAAPAPDLSVMPSPRLTPDVPTAQPAAPILPNAPSPASVLPATTPSKPAGPKPNFSVKSAHRLTPHTTLAQPAAPIVRATPSRVSNFLAIPSSPAAPTPDFSVMATPKVATHVTPAQPVAPVIRVTPTQPSPLGVAPSQPAPPVVEAGPLHPPTAAVTPAKPAAAIAPAAQPKLNVVVVKPGDSLWKLAVENLGKGTRWRELLTVNPTIVDANRIDAGSQIFLPSIASSFRTATRIIVRKGDTLSQMAQTQFGRASLWSCIAQANPAIYDANLIFEGQVLFIPASCKP
jgi:LysM repeat protein